MIVVNSENIKPAKFDNKKKNRWRFLLLLAFPSCMEGTLFIELWVEVVRKICIAEKLVKMHFFAISFFAMITNMFAKTVYNFISSTDPKLSPSFFYLPPGFLFLQSKQHLK